MRRETVVGAALLAIAGLTSCGPERPSASALGQSASAVQPSSSLSGAAAPSASASAGGAPAPFPPGKPLPSDVTLERVALPPALAAKIERVGNGLPAPLPLPPGRYTADMLAPSGTELYAHRNDGGSSICPCRLLWFDLLTGTDAVVADTGTDDYYAFFAGKRFYGSKSVVSYKSHQLIAAERGKTVRLSPEPGPFDSACVVNGKVVLKQDRSIVRLAGGKRELLYEEAGSMYMRVCAPARNTLVITRQTADSNGDGKIDTGDLPSFLLLDFDESGQVTRNVPLDQLQSTSALRYDIRAFLPDGRLVVVEQHDTNDDGKADHKDRRSQRIGVVDPVSLKYEPLTALGDFDQLGWVTAHPAGVIVAIDRASPKKQVAVKVIDGGPPVDWLRLGGAELSRAFFSEDGRRAVLRAIIDTDHDGNHYDWEDDSLYLGWIP